MINDNGGSLTAAAFSGTIGGAVVATGGNTWTGASTDRVLTSVGAFSVAENAQTGYTVTFSADCTGTIALGQTKTCAVTNTQQPQPGLSIVKTASTTTYTSAGQTIVYTYRVTNTGAVTLTGPFTVTDDKLGSFACGSGSLAPGASLTCTKSYVIQAKDLGTVISLPTGVSAIVNTGVWLGGVMSTQDTTISHAGSGVPNGIYPGWCIQDHVPTDLHNQTGTLYSTIGGSLPADVASIKWGKVNWVLNHKIRAAGASDLQFFKDVQTAIWVSVGEQNPEFGISPAAQQMIDAANQNQNYVPGPGDVVAVIVYSDGMTIFPGSIQESILEMRLLQSITNDAFVTTTGVTSAHTQVTVNQVMATGSQPASTAPIDAAAYGDQGTAKTSVKTSTFSTSSGNELLLAFVAADNVSGTNTTVVSVSGGGLVWQLVKRSNGQRGTSEIWRAFASGGTHERCRHGQPLAVGRIVADLYSA